MFAGKKMNGGRQSSALLPPLLVVWVVHLIKKSTRAVSRTSCHITNTSCHITIASRSSSPPRRRLARSCPGSTQVRGSFARSLVARRSFARRSSLVRSSLVCSSLVRSSLVDLRSSSFDRRVSIVELRSSSFDRRASIVDRQIVDRQIADRQIVDRQIATFRQRDLRSAPRIEDRDVAISRDLSSLLSLLSSLFSPLSRSPRSQIKRTVEI